MSQVGLSELIRHSKSTKPKVDIYRMMEVKRYFMSMYRCYSFRLYDMCYISDPFRYNKGEIIKNLETLGVLRDFISDIGKVHINSSTAWFSFCKHRGDEEKTDFLETLYNLLKYREYAIKVDLIFDEYKFYDSKSGFVNIPVTLMCKGDRVSQSSGIVFDTAFARCISNISSESKYVSINDKIWCLAMEELGIPKCDWNQDSLFDAMLNHDDEVSCMEGILNGIFQVSGGKYVEKLNDWLDMHIRGNMVLNDQMSMNTKMSSLGLYDTLFRQSKGIFSMINDVVVEISSSGYQILAVEGDKVYYNTSREYIEFPYGVFSVVCDISVSNGCAFDNEYILPWGNALNGYSGELYTVDRLKYDDIRYVGCPIMMDTLTVSPRGKEQIKSIFLYDLEQTDIDTVATWFSQNVSEYSFEEDIAEEQIVGEPTSDSLEYKLYEGYLQSKSRSDGLIKVFKYDDSWRNYESVKKSLFTKIK